MFLGHKQCFHALIQLSISTTIVYIMHSENRNPCVFPGQLGGVNRSLDMHGLSNRGACVIKS